MNSVSRAGGHRDDHDGGLHPGVRPRLLFDDSPTTWTIDMLAGYWPILLFLCVAGAIGIALIVVGWIAGPRRPSAEKYSPYECGFEAFEGSRMKFDVRYYLIAILFILFDLEIAFLFPWAVVFKDIGIVALIEMFTFLLLLVVGFVYVWKKGALEWD